jgi:hypothetical protein
VRHSVTLSSAPASSFASMSLRSIHPRQEVDVVLKAYVARVCFKCFRCFRDMLQVLHIDVAKINRDIAYVAMVVHVYCKMFVPNVSSVFTRTPSFPNYKSFQKSWRVKAY